MPFARMNPPLCLACMHMNHPTHWYSSFTATLPAVLSCCASDVIYQEHVPNCQQPHPGHHLCSPPAPSLIHHHLKGILVTGQCLRRGRWRGCALLQLGWEVPQIHMAWTLEASLQFIQGFGNDSEFLRLVVLWIRVVVAILGNKKPWL